MSYISSTGFSLTDGRIGQSLNGDSSAPAPTITSVSPNSGSVSGGISVTITGTNLTGATVFTLNGSQLTSPVITSTTITGTTASGSAGLGDVIVTTSGGSATKTNAWTYIALPTIISVSPSSGTVSGGTAITIAGTNLNGATVYTLNGISLTGLTIGPNNILGTTGAGTAGLGNVVVTTPGGTVTYTSAFTYVAIPTITSISPSSGATTGGTSVTITGTNLTGATVYTLNGVALTGVSIGSTTITGTTQAGSASLGDVVVTTTGGTATDTNAWTYVAAPTVTSVNPTFGPITTAKSITVTGTNFSGTPTVTIGGVSCTSVSVSNSTTLTCTTPASAAGSGAVVVGGGTSSATYYFLAGMLFDWNSDNAPHSGTNVSGSLVDSIASNALAIYMGTPTFTANAINGHASINFIDSGSGNTTSMMRSSNITRAQPFAVWAVHKLNTWTADKLLYTFDIQGSVSHGVECHTSSPTIEMTGFNPVAALSSSALAVGAWGLLEGVWNGASSSLTINGGTPATGTVSGNAIALGMWWGGYNGGASGAPCSIARTILADPSATGYSESNYTAAMKAMYGL